MNIAPPEATLENKPVAPADYAIANSDPAATFPMDDYKAAAHELATMPVAPNPAAIGRAAVTVTIAPAILRRFRTFDLSFFLSFSSD